MTRPIVTQTAYDLRVDSSARQPLVPLLLVLPVSCCRPMHACVGLSGWSLPRRRSLGRHSLVCTQSLHPGPRLTRLRPPPPVANHLASQPPRRRQPRALGTQRVTARRGDAPVTKDSRVIITSGNP